MMSPTLTSGWHAELNNRLRGLAGAFLFGTPLLYTMEVWWKGNLTSPARMMGALILTYLSLLALHWSSGFRLQRHETWSRIFADSAEALAIGIVFAALGLWMLRLITLKTGLQPLLGRIVMESIPCFALDFSIASL